MKKLLWLLWICCEIAVAAAVPVPEAKVYALGGAEVSIYRVGGDGKRTLLWRERSADGGDLREVGAFDLHRSLLDPRGLYLIEVRGGRMCDGDLDGRIDPHPAPNRALLRLLADGATIKALPRVIVSFVSEVLYERVAARMRRRGDPDTVVGLLDREAKEILRRDLSGDGTITAADAACFLPTRDRGALRAVYATQYVRLASFFRRHRPILPNLSETIAVIPWRLLGGRADEVRSDRNATTVLIRQGTHVALYDLHDPRHPTRLAERNVSGDRGCIRMGFDRLEGRIDCLGDEALRSFAIGAQSAQAAQFLVRNPSDEAGLDDFAMIENRILLLGEGKLRLLDRRSLQPLDRVDLRPDSEGSRQLYAQPCGRVIAVLRQGVGVELFTLRNDRLRRLGTIPGDGITDVALLGEGKRMVLVDDAQGLLLYDLSDPAHPRLLDRFKERWKWGHYGEWRIETSGDRLAVKTGVGKVALFSLANARFEPIGEMTIEDPIDSDDPFALGSNGRRLLLYGKKGIEVIDTSLIERRVYSLGESVCGTPLSSLVRLGPSTAYGIDTTRIDRIDLRDLTHPRCEVTYEGDPGDDDLADIAVDASGKRLYLADQNQGVRVFQIRGTKLQELEIFGSAQGASTVISLGDDLLLVGEENPGSVALYRIERDAKNLRLHRLDRWRLGEEDGVTVFRFDPNHRRFYAATERSGILIGRVAGRKKITKLGRIEVEANDLLLTRDGGSIAATRDGVHLYDLHGARPRVAGMIPLKDNALSLAIDRHARLLFVGTVHGVSIFDLRTLRRLGRYPIGEVRSIVPLPGQNAALIGGIDDGVSVLDLSLVRE